MGLPDTSCKSYETEFPTLSSLVLDDNIAEDEAVEKSSFDAALDDRQECNESAIAVEKQIENELNDSDTMESLVGFF